MSLEGRGDLTVPWRRRLYGAGAAACVRAILEKGLVTFRSPTFGECREEDQGRCPEGSVNT